MKRHLCLLLAQIAVALGVALGVPCVAEERGPEEDLGWREAEKRVAFNAWGGKRAGEIGWNKGRPEIPTEDAEKRVAFNAWGGKRAGEIEWNKGRPTEEAEKRVAFNAWGGKRGQFSAWGGKRGPEPRAFFPWGGKRNAAGDEGTAEEEDGQSGAVEGGSGAGEVAWGRPVGRGHQHIPAVMSDLAPWERKRLAALWRAAKLQPARQNRRAVGADFFPWGGKRAELSA